MRSQFSIVVIATLLLAAASPASPLPLASPSDSSRHFRRQLPPPQALGSSGLRATACEGSALALSCPAGGVIVISDAFYGRDILGSENLPFTCQTPFNNTETETCSLSPALSAALAVDVGRACDGQASCSFSVDADFNAMFGDPCAGIGKFLRVSYDCMTNLFEPVPPAPEPAKYPTLGTRRPSTFAADKCPILTEAISDVSASAAAWQTRVQPGALTLNFVDIDMSALPALVEQYTGGQRTLYNAYYVHIRALNVFFPGTMVSVGETNKVNMTRVVIEAANIIALPGSVLAVFSQVPDPATGAFGPDVQIKAGRVFGRLDVRYNGLQAGNPLISSYSGSYSLGVKPAVFPQEAAQCSYWTQGSEVSYVYMPLPICEFFGPANQNFNPLCVQNMDPSNPGSNVQMNLNTYMGTGWGTAPVQADGINLPFNTDRFTWNGKSNPHGAINVGARVFYDSEGTPGNTTTTTTSYAGLASSADYSITLDQAPGPHGTLRTIWQWIAMQSPSSTNPVLPNMSQLQSDLCAANPYQGPGNFVSGTISQVPGTGTANPSGYPYMPAFVASVISSCMDEMVQAGRYTEAAAFTLDLSELISLGAAPGDYGISASLGRIFSTQSWLRANRRDLVLQPVPFLSQTSINSLAALEVQHLEALGAQVDAARSSQVEISIAQQAAELAAQAMAAQTQVYFDALQLDKNYVQSLGLAVQQLNASFTKAHDSLNATGKAFVEGVKKKVEQEIFEAAFELVFTIFSILAGGIGSVTQIGKLGKAAGSLGKLFEDISKVVEILKEIGSLLMGIEYIIAASVALDNAINSNPIGNVNLNADIAAALSGNLSSGNIASLASSALAFQNLHDAAYITVGPSINQGIDGAPAYADALAKTANAGGDLVKAQVNYLAAQNKELVAALKYQAAKAEAAALQAQANRLQTDDTAVVDAVIEMQNSLLTQKVRTLGLIWEACAAYEFAKTLPCPVNGTFSYPNLASPTKDFAYQLDAALSDVTQVASLEQCFCNVSWIITEPSFISNLSANASATLDLSDPWSELTRDLRAYDNFHVLLMNLKPFGIVPAGTNPQPTLILTVTSNGEYRSLTTDPASGQRLVQGFMAPTFPVGMSMQPTLDWKVTEYGALIDTESGKNYVPTPYTRFLVEENQLGSRWNWSGVWGVQIELWGFARNAFSGSNAPGVCDICSTLPPANAGTALVS